ncbi:MAG: OsmC family protein [Acetobacteraceae bacterium]
MNEIVPSVVVKESDHRPYGQIISAGRHIAGADEPEKYGGQDTGMAPYELLLASLGACTSMTIRMYADRKEWPLQNVSVALRHVRIREGNATVDRFERQISLSGDLTQDQRQRLLEIADKCPVSQTLSRESRVESSLA